MRGRTQRLLAAGTGLLAIFGYAGALGLITGAIYLGDEINARLPFHSPELVGVAEAVIVAVPMTVVTSLAAKEDARTGRAAVVSGVLLLAWVVLGVVVVGDRSWLQALLAAAGLCVLLVGLLADQNQERSSTTRHGRP